MISFDTSAFRVLDKQLEKLQHVIKSHKDEVVMPYYFQKLQSITFYAHAAGREEIRNAITRTGEARARRGEGVPGRIKSGKFIEGFTLDTGQRIGDTYEFNIGWLNGLPYWAVYQELGFKHRAGMFVTGADALGATRRYIENEMSKLT